MTRLLPIQEICICGPRYQHLLDHAIELEELVRYPLITLAKGTRTRAFYENFFERHGQILNPDIEVETSDLVLPGVRANLGIGFIPETFAHVPLEREEVFQLKLEGRHTGTLCLPRGRYLQATRAGCKASDQISDHPWQQ